MNNWNDGSEAYNLRARAEKAEGEANYLRAEVQRLQEQWKEHRCERSSTFLAIAGALAEAQAARERAEAEFAEAAKQTERFRQACIAAQDQTGLIADQRDSLRLLLQRAGKGLEASKRIITGSYPSWHYAGGPNQCQHGYAAGVPCRLCDTMLFTSVLAEIRQAAAKKGKS